MLEPTQAGPDLILVIFHVNIGDLTCWFKMITTYQTLLLVM